MQASYRRYHTSACVLTVSCTELYTLYIILYTLHFYLLFILYVLAVSCTELCRALPSHYYCSL